MSEGLTDRAKRLFNSLTGKVNDVEVPSYLSGADYDPDQNNFMTESHPQAIKHLAPKEVARPQPESAMSRSRSQDEVNEQDQRQMRALQARLADQQRVGTTYKEGDGSKSNVDHNPSTAGRGRFFGGKR
jgi:hypothetical protein